MNGPLGGMPPTELLMTIDRDDRESSVVLVVHGEVDLSTGQRLTAAVTDALRRSAGRPVVLDLAAVDFLSSSGLGLLVALDEDARAMDTSLRIVVDDTRAVIRPIRTMGLHEVLSLFGTLDEAVRG